MQALGPHAYGMAFCGDAKIQSSKYKTTYTMSACSGYQGAVLNVQCMRRMPAVAI